MQKVQKMRFVNCPHCAEGQYAISKLDEEIGEVICQACGVSFDANKEHEESQ